MLTSVYDLAFKEIALLMDRDKNSLWLKSPEYEQLSKMANFGNGGGNGNGNGQQNGN